MTRLTRSLAVLALLLGYFQQFDTGWSAQAQSTTSSSVSRVQKVQFPERKYVTILPDGRVIYEQPDQVPVFPIDLQAYFDANVMYPKNASKKMYQGKALVRFIVNTTGQTSDAELSHSSGNTIVDQEAMRIVRQMSGWRPATHDGIPVAAYCTLPIEFKNGKPGAPAKQADQGKLDKAADVPKK